MSIPQLHQAYIRKFGRNADADTGDDVWDGSEPYPFPAAALATELVSGSGDDDAAGTGALTVDVYGLDSDYEPVVQTVITAGTTAVGLTTNLLRADRAIVKTAGSGAVNAGAITIQHTVGTNSTTIAQIAADMGQTLMAIYTLPAETYGWMTQWHATSDGSTGAVIGLQVRPLNGAWNTQEVHVLDATANSSTIATWDPWVRFDPKTDFRARILTGGNTVDMTAGFTMMLNKSPRLEFL